MKLEVEEWGIRGKMGPEVGKERVYGLTTFDPFRIATVNN
jgi:hypothetical protein